MHRMVKNCSCPACTFPAEFRQGNALPSCFSFHIISSGFLCDLLRDTVFAFRLFFFVSNFVLHNGPKHSIEMLSNVPKPKKAVMCLTEKITSAR